MNQSIDPEPASRTAIRGHPVLHINGGVMAAAWQMWNVDEGTVSTYLSQFRDEKWSAPEKVSEDVEYHSGGTGQGHQVDLCVGPTGNITVIWQQDLAADSGKIYARQKTPSGPWLARQEISLGTTEPRSEPHMECDNSGNILAIWKSKDDGIEAASHSNSSGWRSAERVVNGGAFYLQFDPLKHVGSGKFLLTYVSSGTGASDEVKINSFASNSWNTAAVTLPEMNKAYGLTAGGVLAGDTKAIYQFPIRNGAVVIEERVQVTEPSDSPESSHWTAAIESEQGLYFTWKSRPGVKVKQLGKDAIAIRNSNAVGPVKMLAASTPVLFWSSSARLMASFETAPGKWRSPEELDSNQASWPSGLVNYGEHQVYVLYTGANGSKSQIKFVKGTVHH